MKKLLFLVVCTGLIYACQPSTPAESQTAKEAMEVKAEETGYDAELAESVGADQYGMRQYVMAFLKAGPNRSQDSIEAAALQKAHLDNIGRLAEEGKLSLAGPFLDGGELRGIYIFNVSTIEEARALTETDPAIQQGRLVMELHPWYGSAALMKVNEIHKRLGKEEI
ncbi:MAG: hypothetical protein HRU41_18625 [Saprospiraceae bacterium]|nr:hypothetical protein [Saprospiraceae bacterium]